MTQAEVILEGLEVQQSIGVSEIERSRKQTLRFDVEVFLPQLPMACQTDNIKDTVDYSALAARLREACDAHEGCQLLEFLAHEALKALIPLLPPVASIKLSVTKINPPIPQLKLSKVTLAYQATGPELKP